MKQPYKRRQQSWEWIRGGRSYPDPQISNLSLLSYSDRYSPVSAFTAPPVLRFSTIFVPSLVGKKSLPPLKSQKWLFVAVCSYSIPCSKCQHLSAQTDLLLGTGKQLTSSDHSLFLWSPLQSTYCLLVFLPNSCSL